MVSFTDPGPRQAIGPPRRNWVEPFRIDRTTYNSDWPPPQLTLRGWFTFARHLCRCLFFFGDTSGTGRTFTGMCLPAFDPDLGEQY